MITDQQTNTIYFSQKLEQVWGHMKKRVAYA